MFTRWKTRGITGFCGKSPREALSGPKCPGVRALAPVAGVTDITVTLATEAGRLVTFAPLLVTDRDALAWLETDVRPDAALPAPVHRLPVE